METVSASKRPRGRPRAAPKPVETVKQEERILGYDNATATFAPDPVQERPEMRAEMRPAMRDEDPRDSAARRAAELRGHLGDLDEGVDEFAAPPAPPGWEYQWKRITVMNQEDPAYAVHIARKGWEPVPSSRHPSYMPMDSKGNTIDRKGQRLMQIPKEIADEFRKIERKKAADQVRQKEAQLNSAPDGQFERGTDPRVRAKISKSYEPIVIPSD